MAGAVGVAGVSGAGVASAHPVSLTLNYSCSVSLFHTSVPMEFHSDLPDSVAVGRLSPASALDATTTVTKDETHLIRSSLGDLKSFEGTVDADTRWHSPDGDFSVPVHFAVAKVTVPGSDRAFPVKATGTAPSRTFHRPGPVQVAVGKLTLRLAGRKADGRPFGTVTATCKLGTPAQAVVASFAITNAGRTTGPAATGTSGAGSTTGSPSGRTSAPTTSTANGTAPGTLSNTGQDTKDLMLLTVGTLAAGGAFFLHGSRLKRRRSGKD